MIELGSAAEQCLWTRFDSTVRMSTDEERRQWALGKLVSNVFTGADPEWLVLMRGVVDPRNEAMHRVAECDRQTVLCAFAIVRELVDAELDQPLPTVDP
jgi:hypothetical protein